MMMIIIIKCYEVNQIGGLREKPVNANSMSKLLIASNGVGKIVVNIFSFIP